MTITFTDENGDDCTLRVERTRECGELGDFSTRTLDLATLDDLRAALPEGYALVELLGEAPTASMLARIYSEAAFGGVAWDVIAGQRALYLAGLAAGRAERERELVATGQRLTEALQRAEAAEKRAGEGFATLVRVVDANGENVARCASAEQQAETLARAWDEGAEAALDAHDEYGCLRGSALDEFYASNPYRGREKTPQRR